MTTAPFEGSTARINVRLTGFPSSQAVTEAGWQSLLEWFARWGDTPTLAALVGNHHQGRPASFKNVARLLETSGFAGIEDFQLWREEAPRDRPEAHARLCTRLPMAWAQFGVSFVAQPLALESLVAPLQAMLAAFASDFGEIWLTADDEPELDVPGLGQTAEHILERWHVLANDANLPGWRHGWLGTVNTWNLLTPEHLAAEVGGTSLQQWIDADATRGRLRQLSDKHWLWSVETARRAALFKALWNTGVIFDGQRYLDAIVWHEVSETVLAKVFDGETLRARIEASPANGRLETLADGRHRWGVKRSDNRIYPDIKWLFKLEELPDGTIVDQSPPKQKRRSKAKQAALDKRNALIALVDAQLELGHATGLVGLGEFFDGNFDKFSLATNIADSGRPSLKRCHQILADLAARDDVRVILCEITETPEAGEPDDDDLWPICNDVLVITSAPLAEVQKAVASLKADEVGEPIDAVGAHIAAQAGGGEPSPHPRPQLEEGRAGARGQRLRPPHRGLGPPRRLPIAPDALRLGHRHQRRRQRRVPSGLPVVERAHAPQRRGARSAARERAILPAGRGAPPRRRQDVAARRARGAPKNARRDGRWLLPAGLNGNRPRSAAT